MNRVERQIQEERLGLVAPNERNGLASKSIRQVRFFCDVLLAAQDLMIKRRTYLRDFSEIFTDAISIRKNDDGLIREKIVSAS